MTNREPTLRISAGPSCLVAALVLSVLVAGSGVAGCAPQPEAGQSASTTGSGGQVAASDHEPGKTEGGPAVSAGAPASIVFIDKQQACECTRKRADDSWSALNAALQKSKESPPVQRIFMDTQEVEADAYRARRPFMVVPGIYFLDAGGDVLELLQGEVTEAQVLQVLARD